MSCCKDIKPTPLAFMYVHTAHPLSFVPPCACSDPVHELSTGCFNFCRFALLEPGQTCSSCCTKSQQQHQPSTATAQLRVDGFPIEGPDASSSSPDAEGDPSRSSRRQQAAPDGLLSQQLKQQQHSQEAVPHVLTQPQHPQQQRFEDGTAAVQLESLTLQQPEAHGSQGASHAYAAPANTTAAAVGAGDLTEEAEEQLMCKAAAGCDSHSSSCGGAAASTSCTNTASAGPCYLALPAGDPAHLGLWQLGTAGGGSQGSGVPQVLLAQRKGAQQPHRGQCMAVVLLQPAVSRGSTARGRTRFGPTDIRCMFSMLLKTAMQQSSALMPKLVCTPTPNRVLGQRCTRAGAVMHASAIMQLAVLMLHVFSLPCCWRDMHVCHDACRGCHCMPSQATRMAQ